MKWCSTLLVILINNLIVMTYLPYSLCDIQIIKITRYSYSTYYNRPIRWLKTVQHDNWLLLIRFSYSVIFTRLLTLPFSFVWGFFVEYYFVFSKERSSPYSMEITTQMCPLFSIHIYVIIYVKWSNDFIKISVGALNSV